MAAAKAIADKVAASISTPIASRNGAKRGKKDADNDPAREDRFITYLQAALEAELGELQVLGFKERNALYVNCIKFLAVLTKYKEGGDGDGAFWGKD